jgi:hypothetical protein
LHNLFCATGDGFKSWVLWFLLLGLPIASSTFSSVVFVCTWVLSFSSLVPLLGVFHLFIYLFIYLSWLYFKYVWGHNFYQGCVCQKNKHPSCEFFQLNTRQ